MISRISLTLVAAPAVAFALVFFTATVSSTPSTLGGEETPTGGATTPTTSAGTPTTAATTSTPTTGGTAAAGTPTTSAGLPATGIADDGANTNASILWLLGLALAAITVGGVLVLSSKRR